MVEEEEVCILLRKKTMFEKKEMNKGEMCVCMCVIFSIHPNL